MMFLSYFFILGLTVGSLLTQSAGRGIDERIYNGLNATRGMFPSQAFIIQTNKEGHSIVCGGSVLSDRWILTAAHCALGAALVEVRLGMEHAKSMSGVFVAYAEEIHIHPKYLNKTETEIAGPQELDSDIAVYKLNQSIPFKDYPYIKTISLPPTSLNKASLLTGKQGLVTGWGHINNNKQFPEVQQYARVIVGSYSQCNSLVPGITENMVCAHPRLNNQGFCQGDSGGPLIMYLNDRIRRVVGVVSFMKGYCDNSTNVYAFIGSPPLLSWITEKTGVQPK